ncbi:MAG: hypothetical protein CVT83_00845 [Alphaproteobacteria bacterium HGW-Alphaproteobacteria-5]|nr:MAG: hypothetical protein CVT83_00845 [Alphaproteobacteria bacterium HGW-Alphaproteobacteria-5]
MRHGRSPQRRRTPPGNRRPRPRRPPRRRPLPILSRPISTPATGWRRSIRTASPNRPRPPRCACARACARRSGTV